jgi:hypothetical protein
MRTKILFITTAIIFMSCLIVRAEDNPINRLFEKYSGKDGFTSVNITKDMFNLMNDFSGDNEKSSKLEDIMKGIDGIKILTYSPENTKIHKKFDFYNEIIKNIPLASYQSLMDVKEAEENVKFLVKKDGKGKISEFLMLVSEEDGGTLIWINGDLDLSKIKKLSKDINIKGLEELEKDKEK